MSEIICPKCKTAFTVYEFGYEEIQEIKASKDAEIQNLKAVIDRSERTKQLAVNSSTCNCEKTKRWIRKVILSMIEIGKIKFIKLNSKIDNERRKKNPNYNESYEEKCIKEGLLLLNYQETNHFNNYKDFNIEAMKQDFINAGVKDSGAITRHINQIISFYDESETTLWITFYEKKLWWTFVDSSKEPFKDEDGNTYRNTKDNKWHDSDIKNTLLTFDRISGALLKTQGFQGTICDVSSKDEFPIEDYTKRLINGEKLEQVRCAEKNKSLIINSMEELIKLLHPKDFEYIVELIFQYSGWKKLTPGAGVEKDLDLDLLMPLTEERAFVQIKSSTDKNVYNDYVKIFNNHDKDYDKFFFAYHSSSDKRFIKSTVTVKNNKPIIIMDISKIAELIVELGLITILIKKVS